MLRKRILIVDDHKLLRDGLRHIISLDPEFEIVGEAQDGTEAIAVIRTTKPDIVLLDLTLPKQDGFSVLRSIKAENPNFPKVLVLTVHGSEQYVHEAFRAGADGYCLKDSSQDELLMAMRSVLSGKMFITPAVAKSVMTGYLSGRTQLKDKSAWESLTPREKEILKLIAESYLNKEIADILGISIKTVEKHRTSLMSKLNLHSSSALTGFAYKHGLVSDGK